MALTKAGNMATDSHRQILSPLISAYSHTIQMAAIHSMTLEV
jgi:hypothetical protein